jgi:4-hydroxy-3-polyprenylbenzoate decarboxylase
MMACWSSVSLIKQVTVVDAQVDPWDAVQVEHARVTLCRADRDIVVIPGMSADRSEPLESGGTVAKIGYDATAKPGDRVEGFAPAAPPSAVLARVRDTLERRARTEGSSGNSDRAPRSSPI